MTAASTRPRTVLGLADDFGAPLAAAPWIGAFVSFGSLLRRYEQRLDGRQLVVAIAVPCRDYVAALIGAGWVLSSPAPILDPPIEVFRAAKRSTFLRGVTDNLIVTGAFSMLEENRPDPRVIIGGRQFLVARYRAVKVLDEAASVAGREEVPKPGFLATLTRAADNWLERLAAPPMDLALVGTAKWLREDLGAVIGNGADEQSEGTRLSSYVLPDAERAATWSTPVIPSAHLGEGAAFPALCLTTILDGYGAIKYLNDITVPIVVCIIDRSIADDSAAGLIIEARLSNSRPISVVDDLKWAPPRAVEALAFTVAL